MSPKYGALHEQVLPAHHTAMQWETAHIQSPLLPDPEQYRWKWYTEMHLYVVMTKLPPASKSIIELFVTAIFELRTGCNTSMCKWLKNGGLKWTEGPSVRTARTLSRWI